MRNLVRTDLLGIGLNQHELLTLRFDQAKVNLIFQLHKLILGIIQVITATDDDVKMLTFDPGGNRVIFGHHEPVITDMVRVKFYCHGGVAWLKTDAATIDILKNFGRLLGCKVRYDMEILIEYDLGEKGFMLGDLWRKLIEVNSITPAKVSVCYPFLSRLKKICKLL